MPIITGVGSPGTLSIASGGNVLAFNNINTTTPTPIVGVDPARTKITFHNPGIIDIFVAPASVSTGAQDVPFVPTIASPGGCFVVYANGGTLVIDGECQKGWQALSRTGSAQPLTVMVSHVV
jgi:hypothetical protein